MRGSISTAVHDLHFSNILTVRFPVPGPTSRTTSVERKLALSTMLFQSSVPTSMSKRFKRIKKGERYSPLCDQWVLQDVLAKAFGVEERIGSPSPGAR
jgi:hypothetical protein